MAVKIPWPMNLLTEMKGSRRVVKCRPIEAIKRSDIEIVNGKFKLKESFKCKIPLGKPFYEEIKHQGHRYFYCRDMEGNYHMYSRNTNKDGTYTDMFWKIHSCLKSLPELPMGTVVDGELICEGKPDSYVPTALKNKEPLKYLAFGLPIHSATKLSVPYYNRQKLLRLMGFNLRINNAVEVYELIHKAALKTHIEDVLNYCSRKNIEGMVLKFDGWSDWYKIKVLQTDDYFVIGFNISSSDSRKGKVTSLKIGCYTDDSGHAIRDMGNIAGISHEMQDEITKNKSDYLYKVCEVIYQEKAANGKLKHGNFVKWHADKVAIDCVEE